MNKQRGIAEIVVILILAGLALSGIGMAVHSYKGAIERAQVAESDAKTKGEALIEQRATVAELRATAKVTDQIMAERGAVAIRRADIERMVSGAIQNVYKQSPEARKWADTPVPDAVLASVRNETPGAGGRGNQDPARPAAGRVDKPNASPPVAGHDAQRGAAGLRKAQPRPPAIVQ